MMPPTASVRVNPNDSEYVNFALCEPTGVTLKGGAPLDPLRRGSLKGDLIDPLKADANYPRPKLGIVSVLFFRLMRYPSTSTGPNSYTPHV